MHYLKNKKSYVSLSLISILALVIISSGCRNKNDSVNQYGLKVIDSPEEYQRSVKKNPDNELIDISEADSTIILDIKYATADNFAGEAVYSIAAAYARKPVIEALVSVQDDLTKLGLGLKVFDAYRPYSVTVKFYEIVQDPLYVATPWEGSRHNRGCAVDVTLVDLTSGKELMMPTPFDETSEEAHISSINLPDEAIKNREILIDVMAQNAFTVYEYEWWHYDFNGWENYDLMDISFKELQKQ